MHLRLVLTCVHVKRRWVELKRVMHRQQWCVFISMILFKIDVKFKNKTWRPSFIWIFFEVESPFQTWSVLTFPDGRVDLYPVYLWNVPPGVSAYIAANTTYICFSSWLTPEGATSGWWHDFRTFVWKVESWENLITYLLNKECFHEDIILFKGSVSLKGKSFSLPNKSLILYKI